MKILNECRTIVPSGYLNKTGRKITEIDENKAFASALCDIVRIPVFNEFDVFMPYENQDPNTLCPLTLYVVEVFEGNFFFFFFFFLTKSII